MKRLNIGVIGAGRIGTVHTETIVRSVPEAQVVAIVDVNIAAAKELAERNMVKSYSADYRTITQNPDIDAVIICSPTDVHALHATVAAKAGKHIFCEKPIALDLDTIRRVLQTVEQSRVKFMVGFNRRFDPNFRKVKDMVVQGKVGEPHIVKITSRDPAPPPAEYVAVSGGMFLDMTIHDFDMARFIVGDEVEEVFAIGAVKVDPAIGKAGDIDTAVITLVFRNGALGIIDNSRQAVYGYDQRVEVFGSGGMVKVDNNAPDTHDYYEAETRDAFIDLLLKEAGWQLDQPRDREFEVDGIPKPILVDGNGMIVAMTTELRGENLQKTLEKFLGKRP